MAAVLYDQFSHLESSCPKHAGNTPASFKVKDVEGITVNSTPYQMPVYREVAFPARGGGPTIRGWLVPASTEALAPAVIVVHGRASCRRSDRVLLAAGMLHRHGFAVLMIDLRNHGDSDRDDGRYAGGTKEYLDVLGAWDWLVGQGAPPARIGLLGESMGAATTMIATGEEPRVAAEWEDSGFANIEEMIRLELAKHSLPEILEPGGLLAARMIGGVDLTARSPLTELRALHGRPLFITHGTADETVPIQQAYELIEALRASGATVDPWIIPGAGHIDAIVLDAAEYEDRLTHFFATALGNP